MMITIERDYGLHQEGVVVGTHLVGRNGEELLHDGAEHLVLKEGVDVGAIHTDGLALTPLQELAQIYLLRGLDISQADHTHSLGRIGGGRLRTGHII